MSQSKVDLSVIILNFNTRDLLRACLSAVVASKLGRYTLEVIVCDNHSTDGSEAMVKREFPQVILLTNKKNLGFAAGNNRGLARGQGRYLLLLNSDTEVSSQAFLAMLEFMETHTKVGAATCKLVLPDGSIDPACHRGFPTPWAAFTYFLGLEKLFPRSRLFGQYHQGYKNLDTIHQVDVISGAFFLVRRETIKTVGVLDNDYYFYGEDMDWCYRIKAAGWQSVYNPTVEVLHHKKQSGRAHPDQGTRIRTQLYFYQYNKLFYQKNYAQRYPRLLMWLINCFFDLRISLLKSFSI